MDRTDLAIVGGGVAGLTAATLACRGGLETVVIDDGDSALARAAHLAAFPGFPAGVNPRLLLHLLREGAKRAGATVVDGRVDAIEPTEGGFRLHGSDTASGASRVVIATGEAVPSLDGAGIDDGVPLPASPEGRTSCPGLYTAGAAAGAHPTAIICAGSGARAAVSALEDAGRPTRDWVAPEGYFSGRGRAIPSGCAEIDDAERLQRERESMAVMERHFAAPHPGDPSPPEEGG